MTRNLIPSGKALGAEVTGIDLSKPLNDADVEFIKAAWREHLVLLFRDQDMEPENLLDFVAAFGGKQETGSRKFYEAAGHKAGSARVSNTPGVTFISNLDEDGKPYLHKKYTAGSLELFWHTDNSYVETPPNGSFLNSLQVPVDGGGVTSFVNQYLAYDTLPDDVKGRLVGLHVKHDKSKNSAGYERVTLHQPTGRDDIEGPVHPIVRIHPDTGRKALYLGRRFKGPSSFIVELGDAESNALLDMLWAHATQEALQWSHSWKPNESLLWDNRCTLHHRSQADPTQARVLQRALIKGDPVIAA